MSDITPTGYDGGMPSMFLRVLLTATVVATVAVTGCSTPEQSVTEFGRNAFCNHVFKNHPTALLESFTANPHLGDAEALRKQVADYNTTAQQFAPLEIKDAVERSGTGTIDLIDLMVSSGFDPSRVDPSESEAVAKSVEASLAATDEVQVWVDENC